MVQRLAGERNTNRISYRVNPWGHETMTPKTIKQNCPSTRGLNSAELLVLFKLLIAQPEYVAGSENRTLI